MTRDLPDGTYRRHGLYYPFFHVRDERWLKVAALYWPKIVRLVPEGYETLLPNSADTTQQAVAARALDGTFLVRQSPGASVAAVAPLMLDVIDTYGRELRASLVPDETRGWGLRPRRRGLNGGAPSNRPTTAVHVGQLAPTVRDALGDAGLAIWADGMSNGRNLERWRRWVGAASNPDNAWDNYALSPVRHWAPEWVVMPERLVAVYTSVLAEDFAAVNRLQPTTDQDNAYAVANNWTSDRIAAALLGRSVHAPSPTDGDLSETLGFLALDLVIPANLDAVPFEKIIEIRERYGAEFLAFGQKVDQVAAGLSGFSDIRDRAVLDQYLRDVVTVQFAQPLEDLRRKMKRLTGDAAVTSISVRTELPTAAVVGGAWVSGHPLIASVSGAALALTAVRRSTREHRDNTLKAAGGTSFLLHTSTHLRPRTLLDHTLHQLARIAGTNIR
ncbi:DUF6236 family protein [Streptomyces sp. NPDC003328]